MSCATPRGLRLLIQSTVSPGGPARSVPWAFPQPAAEMKFIGRAGLFPAGGSGHGSSGPPARALSSHAWAVALDAVGQTLASFGSDFSRTLLKIVRDIKQLNATLAKTEEVATSASKVLKALSVAGIAIGGVSAVFDVFQGMGAKKDAEAAEARPLISPYEW